MLQRFFQEVTEKHTQNTYLLRATPFPIARKLDNTTVLFTKKGYSVTTSRHKNLVREALINAHWEVFETDIV